MRTVDASSSSYFFECYRAYLKLESTERATYERFLLASLSQAEIAAHEKDLANRRKLTKKLTANVELPNESSTDSYVTLCRRLAALTNPMLICWDNAEWFDEVTTSLAILEQLLLMRPLPHSLPWISLMDVTLIMWLEGLWTDERFANLDYKCLIHDKRISEGQSEFESSRTLDLLCHKDFSIEMVRRQIMDRLHIPDGNKSDRERLNMLVSNLLFAYCRSADLCLAEQKQDSIAAESLPVAIGFLCECDVRFSDIARAALTEDEIAHSIAQLPEEFAFSDAIMISRECASSLEIILTAQQPWDAPDLEKAWRNASTCSAIIAHCAASATRE